MAYEMVMPYHLHMPSYFLETFTEYPYRKAISIMRVIFNFILDYSNKKEDDLVWRDACFLENRFLCLCCQ